MRLILRWMVMVVGGLVLLIGSFSLTLMVLDRSNRTEHTATGAVSAADGLARFSRALAQINLGRNLHSQADVERFAQSVGLKKGANDEATGQGLAGNIGEVSRDANGIVHFVGYAFDTDILGDPVTVYLIMDGRAVAKARAEGARQDITVGYRLSYWVAPNVLLNGHSTVPFACTQAKDLIGLVVNQRGEYLVLPPKTHVPITVVGC